MQNDAFCTTAIVRKKRGEKNGHAQNHPIEEGYQAMRFLLQNQVSCQNEWVFFIRFYTQKFNCEILDPVPK
jgi:hypothetical protein